MARPWGPSSLHRAGAPDEGGGTQQLVPNSRPSNTTRGARGGFAGLTQRLGPHTCLDPSSCKRVLLCSSEVAGMVHCDKPHGRGWLHRECLVKHLLTGDGAGGEEGRGQEGSGLQSLHSLGQRAAAEVRARVWAPTPSQLGQGC